MEEAQCGEYGKIGTVAASELRLPIFPLEIEDMIWQYMIDSLPARSFKYETMDESRNQGTAGLKWKTPSNTGCPLTWTILQICRRSRELLFARFGLEMWFGKIQSGQRMRLDQFFNMEKDILYLSGSTNIRTLYQWWFDLEKFRDTTNVENLAISLRADQESHTRSNPGQQQLGGKFPLFLRDIFPKLKRLYFVIENIEESLDSHKRVRPSDGKSLARLSFWAPENYFYRGLLEGYFLLGQTLPSCIFTGTAIVDRNSQWRPYDNQGGVRFPTLGLELIGECQK